jgi:hypothetical protein
MTDLQERPHTLVVVAHAGGILHLTDEEHAEYEAAKAAGNVELADFLVDLANRFQMNVSVIEPDGNKVTADEQHAACIGHIVGPADAPVCCGQPMELDTALRVWRCQHRGHHLKPAGPACI